MDGWGGPTEGHVHSPQTDFVLFNFSGGRERMQQLQPLSIIHLFSTLRKWKEKKNRGNRESSSEAVRGEEKEVKISYFFNCTCWLKTNTSWCVVGYEKGDTGLAWDGSEFCISPGGAGTLGFAWCSSG